MPTTTLSLLVLHTAEVEAALAFYQTLGLAFVQEQHGSGPIHYSCQIGNTVIEIFPGKPGTAPDRREAGATMLGFQVENVNDIVAQLQTQGFIVLTALQDSAWGRRAVVQDPDGRAVEITGDINSK